MRPYKLIVTSIVDPKCADEPRTVACQDILGFHGYEHQLYVDYLWHGWASKLAHLFRAVEELVAFTHIMFLDARDVVVLAGADEVMGRFFALDHPWIYNAEVSIWSPGSFQPDDYPPCDTPFRYLNSGAFIGEREHMAHWLNKWTGGNRDVPKHLPRGDQDWIAARYLDSYPDAIKLDTGCKLFQCMCGTEDAFDITAISPGRVHNKVTGTDPLIIHFNGGTDITDDKRRILWQHWI